MSTVVLVMMRDDMDTRIRCPAGAIRTTWSR